MATIFSPLLPPTWVLPTDLVQKVRLMWHVIVTWTFRGIWLVWESLWDLEVTRLGKTD
jgi:thiosulfate reductase cytochrome b subunit